MRDKNIVRDTLCTCCDDPEAPDCPVHEPERATDPLADEYARTHSILAYRSQDARIYAYDNLVALVKRAREEGRRSASAPCRCKDYLAEIAILREHLQDAHASGWRSSNPRSGALDAIGILTADREEWKQRALLAEKSCHELNSRVNELRGLCDNLESRAVEVEQRTGPAQPKDVARLERKLSASEVEPEAACTRFTERGPDDAE